MATRSSSIRKKMITNGFEYQKTKTIEWENRGKVDFSSFL
jgi:hypothetical protein